MPRRPAAVVSAERTCHKSVICIVDPVSARELLGFIMLCSVDAGIKVYFGFKTRSDFKIMIDRCIDLKLMLGRCTYIMGSRPVQHSNEPTNTTEMARSLGFDPLTLALGHALTPQNDI